MPPALTVYTRSCCHLCEEMISGLQDLQARFVFELRVVDVDADPDLERRFGAHVPVLMDGERELCRHRLQSTLVAAHLAKMS